MNWIRQHRVPSQLIGFLIIACVFGFVGWSAGLAALAISVLAFEVITRTGKKKDRVE